MRRNFIYNVLCTPKFHCKLAGEGIEYAWGASKRNYRGILFARKRTVSAFCELVNDCVSSINVPMMKKKLLTLPLVQGNNWSQATSVQTHAKNQKLNPKKVKVGLFQSKM